MCPDAAFDRPAAKSLRQRFSRSLGGLLQARWIARLDFAPQRTSLISDQVTAPVIRQTIKRGHGNM
jgi:hypothetical protein